MRLLLDDRLAPITTEIGFLELKCQSAVSAFVDWQASIYTPLGISVARECVGANSLEGALQCLLPLTSVKRTRELFVPTKERWTAFFDNGVRGTDAMGAMQYLAETHECRALRVVAVPNTVTSDRVGGRGRYGATMLEIFGPGERDTRSIAVANDGGKWKFVAVGTPQPFEQHDRYECRKVRERFTLEMLERYLHALGVDAFDETFYVPSEAVLIRKLGALPTTVREYSLDEARANF